MQNESTILMWENYQKNFKKLKKLKLIKTPLIKLKEILLWKYNYYLFSEDFLIILTGKKITQRKLKHPSLNK